MNQADMENSLRAVLAERANRVPDNDLLAERIIQQAGSASVRSIHSVRRRSWTLPLLTLAAAAAVVVAAVGITSINQNSRGHGIAAPLNTHVSTPPPNSTSTTPAPKPIPAVTTSHYIALDATEDDGATQVHLDAFKAVDLTFVGPNIWAMGSATCIATGKGRCSALVHSTDGVHWTMLANTPFNIADDTAGCATVCVDHIRFATPTVGYIYGPSTLMITTNAGRTWRTLPGGAVALETLDNNVIRVSSPQGCPPGCTYTVQTAAIGSTTWKTVTLPGSYLGDGVTLARTGHSAYLLTVGNPAGGAQDEQSTLFASHDDGATWVNRGEVCPQQSGQDGEVDSTGMTAGSDGSVIVACQPRLDSATAQARVVVSTNGGASFHATAGRVPASDPTLLGSGTAQTICVDDAVLYCSQNGGASFAKAEGAHGGPAAVSWLGFEDETDGRALEIGGSAANGPTSDLWTTTDGGATWRITTTIG